MALSQQLRRLSSPQLWSGEGGLYKLRPGREISQKSPALTNLQKMNAVVSTDRFIPSGIQRFQVDSELLPEITD